MYIFYHTFIFPTITYFSPHPLRKLIFRHYILSFPLSHHTSSGITQITFLNAPSKSPYKQMQSLTRNNHITSNHLSSLASIPSKRISAITFFSKPPFHTHLQPHSCKKIGRVTKSATLPYTFYIFEVLMSPLRFGRCKTDIHRMSCTLICGMVHRNTISDFHSSA